MKGETARRKAEKIREESGRFPRKRRRSRTVPAPKRAGRRRKSVSSKSAMDLGTVTLEATQEPVPFLGEETTSSDPKNVDACS